MKKKYKEKPIAFNPVTVKSPAITLKTTIICTAIFFIIQLIGICNHTPWRDEFQAFQIAMNSHSISDLFFNMRQEGHGALWYILLYVITRFTHNIFAMQFLHITIAAAGIFILFRYAPFSLLEKIVISLGYFFFFEYAQVSREYILGIFFVLCICSLLGQKYYRAKLSGAPAIKPALLYAMACFLILLADTSMYGLILSASLAVYFLWCIYNERNLILSSAKLKRALFFTILIVLAGWVLAIIQMMPPPGNGFAHLYHSSFPLGIGLTLSELLVAYCPFPAVNNPYWNTYYIWPGQAKSLAIIAVIVIAVVAVSFIKKPQLLLLYLMSTLAVGALIWYVNIFTASRFFGHSFIALFICFWFDRYVPSAKNSLPVIPTAVINRLRKFIFYLLIVTQAVTGLFFYYLGLTIVFSNCTKAGEYVIQNHLDRFPAIGGADFIVCPISYYTNKPILTFNRNDTSRFVIWDEKRSALISPQNFVNLLLTQINNSPNDTCLICSSLELLHSSAAAPNEQLLAAIDSTHTIKLIKQIDNQTMVAQDSYYFYLAWKIKKPSVFSKGFQ